MAAQYYDPAFDTQAGQVHDLLCSSLCHRLALSWFWDRFKGVLTGSFLTKGIEFGFVYALIAIFPVMWLIYSAMNVSLAHGSHLVVFGLLQGLVAGLVFEKLNP